MQQTSGVLDVDFGIALSSQHVQRLLWRSGTLLHPVWKSSRHSHTSFIVTAASSPHPHFGDFMSRLLLGGVAAARMLCHRGVGRAPPQNCRLWTTLESGEANRGKSP